MAVLAPAHSERERLRQAIQHYSTGRDPALRNEIVSAYQGLAYSLAGRFTQVFLLEIDEPTWHE